MNIVVEKQPKCIATLRVEIPADRVTGERNQIVRGYAQKARVPGFRPGKAPLALIEKRYDKEIAEELHSALISEAYDEAFKRESLQVLDFGVPQNLTTHPDGTFSFESRLLLAPDVQLPDYKGITVKVPPVEVPEEDVNKQLERLREQYADYADIGDRPAALGDMAIIDYTSTVDGQATAEFLEKSNDYLTGREGFWVRIDEKSFLPGFAAQLVDMNVGDSKEITLSLPEDFPVAKLASKELVFQTKLTGLKSAALPELDDEFAQRLNPDTTIEQVREIIRTNMATERRRRIDDMKVDQIVAYFNEQVDFELPDELITQETQNQVDSMVERGIRSGMSEEDVAAQQAEIFATAGNAAASNLRTNFILQEIARTEGIKISDNELVTHLAQIAASRKVAPKKFIRDLQRANRLPGIRNSMTIGKTIDFLVEHATVEETSDTLPDE